MWSLSRILGRGGGSATIRVLDNVEKRKPPFPAINQKHCGPLHIHTLTFLLDLMAINNFIIV
jgi:hypothetical protein